MKIIAPHANTSLLPIQNVLFVLRPWTLKARQDGSWGAVRDYIVHYRANPRTTEYMLDLAGNFANIHAAGASIDLLVSESLLVVIPEKYRTWPGRIFTDFSFEELNKKNYDTVVLLYHDPIGLGWEEVEKTLKKLNASQYIVINGRKREFLWDQDARRAITFRRFLAKAWWLEILLVPWVWTVAIFFYLSDTLTGKTRNEA